jgi:hypothetical protein
VLAGGRLKRSGRCRTLDGEPLPFFEAVAQSPQRSLLQKATSRLQLGPSILRLDHFQLGLSGQLPDEFALDTVVDRLQKRAFTAAVGCVLTGELDPEPIASLPPPLLTANDCELLRVALLTDQSGEARAALLLEAQQAAASLRDELEKQAWLASTCTGGGGGGGGGDEASPRRLQLSQGERQRQAAMLDDLRKRLGYRSVLRVARLRAVGVLPGGGWERGLQPKLCVVARALGPELDPERDYVREFHPAFLKLPRRDWLRFPAMSGDSDE